MLKHGPWALFKHNPTSGFLQAERPGAFLGAAMLMATMLPAALCAQISNGKLQSVDASRTVTLKNHHPQWASAANSIGAVPPDTPLDEFTLVLARSADRQQAFEQFLEQQQNPASPEFHHWLAPEEVGTRFGVSDADVASIESWLQSSGLHVNWVSPSRMFVGFGGTAANVGHAFETELRYYNVNGALLMSVAGDPAIPQALVPLIGSVRGLYAIDERPLLHTATVQSVSPDLTTQYGNHYLAPSDFSTIYDIPANTTGEGTTIGIVSWSRINGADLDNFRSRTGTSFPDPVEVVPTAYGGVDPGPAYTTPQSCTHCLDGQMEATLDVQRAGSTAPGAGILLVVSSSRGSGGGIGADAQYLVNTSPIPAQVMSISFGSCELSAGTAGVNYWNTLFQQAAAEGISVFVSSGDSGAAGCDTSFAAPPYSPAANSPNYICSSSYATCVGGTQFNDTGDPTTYWNPANSPGYLSALGYIPEGGWNESTTTSVAASGGGVSSVIATPQWQTGTGVPTARAGRYTPDISFTSATHDGYFGCLAAAGGGCGGSQSSFVVFSGTSAAAPAMAAVAAVLDQAQGSAQGNLNPQIYGLAASNSAVFHDATVSTSGVTNCDVNTVSACNNSAPSRKSLTGGQPGYLLTAGFDEVTGLGSLDVAAFLNSYSIASRTTPTISVTPSATSITSAQALSLEIVVGGGSSNPTGSVTVTSGTYSSAPVALVAGHATIGIGAGALPLGDDQLTVIYSPDSASANYYNPATGAANVTVTAVAMPGFTLSATTVTIAVGATSGNSSTITVSPLNGFTGSVALTASIASVPSGATNLPTLSFGSTSPVTIDGTNPGTATLTIATIATQSSTCVASGRSPGTMNTPARGAALLACVALFGLARRRRKFRSALALLALLVALATGMLACGGVTKTNVCPATVISGTSTGSYTVTITGTSGTATATRTLSFTIQ